MSLRVAQEVYNSCVSAVNKNNETCRYRSLRIYVKLIRIKRNSLSRVPIIVDFGDDKSEFYPSASKLLYKSLSLETFLKHLNSGKYALMNEKEFLYEVSVCLYRLQREGRLK